MFHLTMTRKSWHFWPNNVLEYGSKKIFISVVKLENDVNKVDIISRSYLKSMHFELQFLSFHTDLKYGKIDVPLKPACLRILLASGIVPTLVSCKTTTLWTCYPMPCVDFYSVRKYYSFTMNYVVFIGNLLLISVYCTGIDICLFLPVVFWNVCRITRDRRWIVEMFLY